MIPVAILGANGFIGGRIVERFHLSGLATVRPVVRSMSGLARLARFDLEGSVADALDEAALRHAFAGCSVVIHAVAGDPAVILGTLAPVYRAAQAAGVRRLVYLSTASVHGQAPAPGTDERSPLSENQPLAYNRAKVRAEQDLLKLRERGQVEVVLLRPGIVWGPRSVWIANFAAALLAGEAYLIDRGQGICNSIYIDNLVHAIYQALQAPGVDGEAMLVGDDEQVTWADLYRPVAETLGFELAQLPEAAIP
nr:NAD-dependent epimerase/dehydratase family protein [Caldilineaceae bacterium]